jgi:hypothetical protein
MRKPNGIHVAALAVGLAALAPAGQAAAQTGAAPGNLQASRPAPGQAASPAGEVDSVLGREVRTTSEENVGRIIDLLASRTGEVKAAVIEFGGFLGIGTRKIAVEWSALRFEADGKQPVLLDMNRDQLRVAPEYKPGDAAAILKPAK